MYTRLALQKSVSYQSVVYNRLHIAKFLFTFARNSHINYPAAVLEAGSIVVLWVVKLGRSSWNRGEIRKLIGAADVYYRPRWNFVSFTTMRLVTPLCCAFSLLQLALHEW